MSRDNQADNPQNLRGDDNVEQRQQQQNRDRPQQRIELEEEDELMPLERPFPVLRDNDLQLFNNAPNDNPHVVVHHIHRIVVMGVEIQFYNAPEPPPREEPPVEYPEGDESSGDSSGIGTDDDDEEADDENEEPDVEVAERRIQRRAQGDQRRRRERERVARMAFDR
uniref:Anaphase-promoting complex subunit 13 n=1 Tax=Caenorhabditis tropicalis TaxID=1561998 RepID=A0A1I7TCU4_9PELO